MSPEKGSTYRPQFSEILVFEPPMMRLGSVKAAFWGVLSMRPYATIRSRFSSSRTISLWATSTETELNEGLGSSIWRKGARVMRTVLRAAGAFAASCDCGVAPRSTPKRGTTDNRNKAKLAGTQNANRRTALLNILSVSLLACPDPPNKEHPAFFSLDVNLSGTLSNGTCAKAS